MRLRKAIEKDFDKIMGVAKKLHPKWFDKFAISKSIPLDLKIHKGFVVEEKGKIYGFITYTSKEGAVDISWLGVDPKLHRKKIGTKLINFLEKELKKIGVKELRVETLAESVEYEPYERTRIFYKKIGFQLKDIKKIKSKDTGEWLDMAILVKKLI